MHILCSLQGQIELFSPGGRLLRWHCCSSGTQNEQGSHAFKKNCSQNLFKQSCLFVYIPAVYVVLWHVRKANKPTNLCFRNWVLVGRLDPGAGTSENKDAKNKWFSRNGEEI